MIEKYIDEMKPTASQKKKLLKLLKYFSVEDWEGIRIFRVPIGLGVRMESDYAAIDYQREAGVLKHYVQDTWKKKVDLVSDCMGGLWLRSAYTDTVYDDFRDLFIKVESKQQADMIVKNDDHDNSLYYAFLNPDEMKSKLVLPFVRCNNDLFFYFFTDDQSLTIEEEYLDLLYYNDAVKNILRNSK